MADEGAPKPANGAGGSGSGAALGFALAAKPKRGAKVQVQVAAKEEERQLITGIEGTRIKAAAPAAPAAGPRVIPSMGNTYRAGVGKGAGGFVPSFRPPSSEDALKSSNQDRFEAAPQDDRPKVSHYGLQTFGAAAAAAAAAAAGDAANGEQQQQQDGGAADPQAAADALPPPPPRAGPAFAPRARGGDNKAQFFEELNALPEQMDADDYEATPVDEFAKALLRGMGWREGEGVGRSKQAVEVKQIVPRPERLGLGADPAKLPAHLAKPKVVRMGESGLELLAGGVACFHLTVGST
jgi:G patch domain/KOW motif-containing protein